MFKSKLRKAMADGLVVIFDELEESVESKVNRALNDVTGETGLKISITPNDFYTDFTLLEDIDKHTYIEYTGQYVKNGDRVRVLDYNKKEFKW
jgi:hypothetical protein